MVRDCVPASSLPESPPDSHSADNLISRKMGVDQQRPSSSLPARELAADAAPEPPSLLKAFPSKHIIWVPTFDHPPPSYMVLLAFISPNN